MSRFDLPHFNLSPSLDYSKFGVAFEDLLTRHETADEVFRQLGRSVLMEMFASASPGNDKLLKHTQYDLRHAGALILHDTGVDSFEDELAQLTAIVVSSAFGHPSATDQKTNKIAWPIKYDPDSPLNRTYSQSLGEAAFHTDTQYFPKPERFFSMFCVVADEEGKGTSELIDGKELIDQYKAEYGDDGVAILERKYPFKVPSIFTKTASDEDLEVTWAPIYDPRSKAIRYRKDTITDALRLTGSSIDDQQHEALGRLEDIIKNFDAESYHLMPGDAVIVDNHRMLHARTSFDSPERLLYRVRMDTNA